MLLSSLVPQLLPMSWWPTSPWPYHPVLNFGQTATKHCYLVAVIKVESLANLFHLLRVSCAIGQEAGEPAQRDCLVILVKELLLTALTNLADQFARLHYWHVTGTSNRLAGRGLPGQISTMNERSV